MIMVNRKFCPNCDSVLINRKNQSYNSEQKRKILRCQNIKKNINKRDFTAWKNNNIEYHEENKMFLNIINKKIGKIKTGME